MNYKNKNAHSMSGSIKTFNNLKCTNIFLNKYLGFGIGTYLTVSFNLDSMLPPLIVTLT